MIHLISQIISHTPMIDLIDTVAIGSKLLVSVVGILVFTFLVLRLVSLLSSKTQKKKSLRKESLRKEVSFGEAIVHQVGDEEKESCETESNCEERQELKCPFQSNDQKSSLNKEEQQRELESKRAQLENIFRLLKEQNESMKKPTGGSATGDIKFSVKTESGEYEEVTEEDLKEDFESQLKLYGLLS